MEKIFQKLTELIKDSNPNDIDEPCISITLREAEYFRDILADSQKSSVLPSIISTEQSEVAVALLKDLWEHPELRNDGQFTSQVTDVIGD